MLQQDWEVRHAKEEKPKVVKVDLAFLGMSGMTREKYGVSVKLILEKVNSQTRDVARFYHEAMSL